MEPHYQASIARTRQAEAESRERRRALRNAQQERVTRAREAHAHRCFLSDVHFHIARRSIAEENVMYTLRTTAACWAEVCDRAITRQLDIEAAQRDHSSCDAAYLERTREREVLEQLNIEDSDTTRWKELNMRHAAGLQVTRAQAVQDAVGDIWTRTAKCLTTIHRCRLDHAGTELLVALAADACLLPSPALTTTTTGEAAEGKPLRSSPAATKEAFRHIFNGSPYPQSSAGLLALLQYCYTQYHVPVPLANVLHLCPVPILAVDGPKYSGKTLLTDFLKSKYRLLCISDEGLVRQALQAAEKNHGTPPGDSENAIEEGNSDDSRAATTATGDNVSSKFTAEWAAHGQRIHEALLSGESVSATTVSELLYLRLRELQADSAQVLPYDALLLEGVLCTADSYKVLAQRFQSLPTHPYEALRQRWNLAVTAAVDGQTAIIGGASVQSLHNTTMSSSGATTTTTNSHGIASDVPDILRLQSQLAVEHDLFAKLEPKARPLKKVDLAALPPPELPEVTDTKEQQEKERAFVAQANHELSTLPAVLSGVLHIDCSPEEIFRRFAGLRLDVETGTVYHLTYNPPPKERLPHVVNLGRPDVSSVDLHEAVFRHREEWTAVQRWLSRQPPDAVFARVYELAGDSAVPHVQEDALQAVEQIFNNFRISQQVLTERDAAAARLVELEAAEKAQMAEREGERLRLAAAYNEKGVALPPLLQTPVEGAGRSVASLGAPAAGVILQAVSDFTDEYEEEYGAMWLRATQLAKLLLEYFNGAEEQVAAYWMRPDDKQVILQRFQNSFDAVPAQLRAQAGCKAELHLSIDDLNDALHHCIELRDAEARGLIEVLCSPASFLVGWESLVCQDFLRLLQCEADRFVLALHLFTFFFGAITGEPLAFDEVEIEMPVLTLSPADRTAHTSAGTSASATASGVEASATSVANVTSRSGREKRTTTSKKTHGKAAEESQEKSVEEQFADAVQSVLSGAAFVTDKLKGMLDAQAKGQKRTGGGSGGAGSACVAATAHFSHATAKCLELMEAERAVTASRVAAIHGCMQTLLREAEAHAQQRRTQLESTLVTQMAKEAAAVNTAVYVLRGCVEIEQKSPPMHLGCTTFAVTQRRGGGGTEARRSFITDVPLSSQLHDPQVTLHPGLSAARLLDLIRQFRCVAPDYQLSRFDFLVLVRESDYAVAVATRLDTAHTTIKSCEEVFDSFDPQRCGFLDWRELVVHLLFWVVPAPATPAPSTVHDNKNNNKGAAATAASVLSDVPEVSLQDLIEMRVNLGYTPLTEERFFDLPFFYDRYLDELTLVAYTRVLWCTFRRAATQTVDPYVLLGFLCADPQPIRGAQKAFQLLSPPDAAARVTLEEMDALCHLKATNARAMSQSDPCSKVNLRLLFGAASTLSFEDVCLSSIGRKMLNHADLYRRRTFVKRKPL